MKTPEKKEVVEFLMAQKAGVLSTVSGDQPHASYIYYVADEDMSIYFATPVNSQKHENIQVHNKVAFTVATINPPQTVQLEGSAEVVVDENTIKAVTANYYDIASSNKHSEIPITKLNLDNGLVIYRINPRSMRWSDFSKKDNPVTRII